MNFVEKKVMELNDHPKYVQTGFNKHILFMIILIGCTLAAALSFRKILFLLYGFVICFIYAAITLHLYYILTRDKALVLKGVCVDITTSNLPFTKKAASKILIKDIDDDNPRTYAIAYQGKYNCNIGDEIELYTVRNAMYLDTNEYVVISRPLFIKVNKNK